VLTEQTFYTPKYIRSYVSIYNICGFLVKSMLSTTLWVYYLWVYFDSG